MSRAAKFYEKYNLETPEQKKEREEAELKAKKKEARKARKAVKERVAEEMGDFTGINKDWEGKLIKKMVEQKEAEKTPYEHLDEIIAKYNLPVAKDYVAVDKAFLNKLVEDTKLNAQRENEEMNAEQIKAIVAEAVAEMTKSRNEELALQLKLQEAKNRELEIQLEMARLAAHKYLTAEDVEVAAKFEAQSQVEVQFKERPVRVARQKVFANSVRNKVEEVVSLEGKLTESYTPADGPSCAYLINNEFATPVRKGRGGYTISWSKVINNGTFNDTVINVIEAAIEKGVNPIKTNAFRKLGPVYQGAYMQYAEVNKGQRGAWKEFIEQYITLV